jgi:hypothetical protein
VYFIWWSRNLSIFQGKYIPLEMVASMVHKLAVEFRTEPDKGKRCITKMLDLREGTLGDITLRTIYLKINDQIDP